MTGNGGGDPYGNGAGPQYFNPGPQAPQAQPAAAPQTLGSVAQTSQGGAFGDYLQQYQQALQVIRQTQPRGHMDPPSILRNILSFGRAGADYDATQLYNAAQDNRAQDMARAMVASKANSDALSNKELLNQAGFLLNMARLKEAQQNDDFNHFIKGSLPPPKNAGEAAAYEAQGYGLGRMGRWEQGRGARLQGSPETGWQVPPDSPIGKAQTALGGGTAQDDTGPARPGETLSQTLGRQESARKAKEKTMVATSPTRTMSELAKDVIDQIQTVKQNMQGLNLGPLASRVRSAKTALGFDDPKFKTYSDNVDLLKTLTMRMHTGSRGSEMMLRHFDKMLNQRVQGPANMYATLQAIQKYAEDLRDNPGTSPETVGSSTFTPSTTTTSSSVPSAFEGGGVDIESILKKHGY